jgi:hypothetical protein
MTSDNNAYIEIKVDDDHWLHFTRNITRRQSSRYVAALFPEPQPTDAPEQTAEEPSAEMAERDAEVRAVLSEVLVDASVVFDGEPVQGIEAIFAALDDNPDGITLIGENLLATGFTEARNEAYSLGNVIKPG